jgi:hypothetical protein
LRTLLAVFLVLLAGPALAGGIAGKIVDELGKPVAGVEVSVHDPTLDRWIVSSTSAGGRFTLAGHWEKPVALLARKVGYLPLEIDGVGPIVRDLVIVLRKPGRLVGKVIGPTGLEPGERIFVNLRPLHPELAAGILRAESKPDGTFVFEGLREGWYDVMAIPRIGPGGIVRAVHVPPKGPLEVLLPPQRFLIVTLLDAERAPIPHARLTLRYLSDRWALSRPPIEVLTSPNGKAALKGLPVIGGAILIAEVPDRAPLVRRVDLVTEETVELRVRPGDVLTAKGPGGSGENVRVRFEPGHGIPSIMGRAGKGLAHEFEGMTPGHGLLLADVDGISHFRMAMVRPGRKSKAALGSSPGKTLEVQASLDGQPAADRWLALSKKWKDRGAVGFFEGGVAKADGMAPDTYYFYFRNGDTQALGEVKPGPARPLNLRSRTPGGKVMAKGRAARGVLVLTVPAGVMDAPGDHAPSPEPTRTDATGRFETPPVAGGPWRLVALDPEHAPVFMNLPSGGVDDLSVTLVPGALLRIHVKDPGGRPVLDARVVARDGSGRRVTVLPRLTDADGQAILLLAPGTWHVEVEAPDLGRASARVKLGAAGAEATLSPTFR